MAVPQSFGARVRGQLVRAMPRTQGVPPTD
jgi:hypothetical protein